MNNVTETDLRELVAEVDAIVDNLVLAERVVQRIAVLERKVDRILTALA